MSGLFAPALPFEHKSEQEALVDVGVAQEEAALRTEFVRLCGEPAASGASLV